MRKLRRLWLILVLLVVGGTSFTVLWSIRQAGSPGRLSQTQWRRLMERLARRRAAREHPAAVQGAPSTPAPPPEPARRPAVPELDPAVRALQDAEYVAERPKTVIELQRFRSTESIAVRDGSLGNGTATLINLNPTVNAWYLLELTWPDGAKESYHLANIRPAAQELDLDAAFPDGVMLVTTRDRVECDLWSPDAAKPIREAARARSPYVLLCDGQVALRIQTPGNRTPLEWATDFLRDNVWGGEKITVFVRQTLFKDAFLATSDVLEEAGGDAGQPGGPMKGWPLPARLADDAAEAMIEPVDLGISLDGVMDGRMHAGGWYRARDRQGIYVSVVAPDLLAPDVLSSYPSIASPLDDVEKRALAYLVAFDLDQFEVGFSVGTDHPRVGWSERVPEAVRDPSLPGPDGIGDIVPLVAAGIVPPAVSDRIAATFTGGFKRAHGAFRTSALALTNHGSHYGFIDSGVVLSKLQPGLATLYVTVDGRLDMKTWGEEDNSGLESIAFARQNGVPIVEIDPASGRPRPGQLVGRWGLGNWSGSQDQRFRTLRAGACLQETTDARFLVYGYFSSATPSAMARVFQAYDCSYAMLLDINALEHTYLALYHLKDSTLSVEHLIDGMDVLDKKVGGSVLPRFLAFADNRDFFYVVRRAAGANGELAAADGGHEPAPAATSAAGPAPSDHGRAR